MCRFSPLGRKVPCHRALTVPLLSVPLSSVALRCTVMRASAKRTGSVPQLLLRTTQGLQCSASSWRVASHVTCTSPMRVGSVRPCSCCAIHGVVPHWMRAATPTSSLIGPACTLVDQSPGAGRSTARAPISIANRANIRISAAIAVMRRARNSLRMVFSGVKWTGVFQSGVATVMAFQGPLDCPAADAQYQADVSVKP